MAKPYSTWTVLPHRALEQLDSNLLSVEGDLPMPIGAFPRRMTIAKLASGELVVYSAIALDDREMAVIDAFGRVAYLVVPNAIHRMDVRIWKQRYPQAKVIAPAGATEAVGAIVDVDASQDICHDDTVQYVTVPGTGDTEGALVVRSPGGTTLVVNDLLWNLQAFPGLGGKLIGLLGFLGPRPKLPPVVRLRTVKDRRALADQLITWSRIDGLTRLIVAHGAIHTANPQTALLEIAATLI